MKMGPSGKRRRVYAAGFPYAPGSMRRALALLAVGSAVAACGGDDGPSDEEQVRTAAREYLVSFGEGGDPGDACGRMTTEARRAVVETVTAAFPNAAELPCEEAVRALSADLPPERRRALKEARIVEVKIAGDSADVRADRLPGTTKLTRVDGEWQVVRSGAVG